MAALVDVTRNPSDLVSLISLQLIAVFAGLGSIAPRAIRRRASSSPQHPSAVMGINKDLHQANLYDHARMSSI